MQFSCDILAHENGVSCDILAHENFANSTLPYFYIVFSCDILSHEKYIAKTPKSFM